ncbi:MAG: hypothetical protein IPN46_19520 [Saprospiraceae bacterium]|nr:hypothetical protein [Saprospiraceae bacterium]
MKSNPDVHPNDVEPVLASSCGTTYTKSFNDAISQLNATTLLITRTWSAFNNQTNVKTTFVQNHTIDISQASVCAFHL